jgi:hypothetical protein
MSVDVGVGVCPKRDEGLGHVWESWRVDPRKPCVFCGRPGRDNVFKGESGGFFAEATAARSASFQALKPTMESGSGKPERVRQEMDRRAEGKVAKR